MTLPQHDQGPHLQDADFTLFNCDVLDGLRELPDESVHCVVTCQALTLKGTRCTRRGTLKRVPWLSNEWRCFQHGGR